MAYWAKGKNHFEYSQKNIGEIFTAFLESTSLYQKIIKKRYGYQAGCWAIVEPKYLTKGEDNKYKDFTMLSATLIQIKDLDNYLPDYVINQSKPQNILFGHYIFNNMRMQIIDMHKYNKEIISYLVMLKAKISVTENFRRRYKVGLYILDADKIIMHSYNYVSHSEEWNTFTHIIDIKQPFRYIIYDYNGDYFSSVTNTCIRIVF